MYHPMHQPLPTHHQHLTLSLGEGDTEPLVQVPKSFQAGHFLLKSCFPFYFFPIVRMPMLTSSGVGTFAKFPLVLKLVLAFHSLWDTYNHSSIGVILGLVKKQKSHNFIFCMGGYHC